MVMGIVFLPMAGELMTTPTIRTIDFTCFLDSIIFAPPPCAPTTLMPRRLRPVTLWQFARAMPSPRGGNDNLMQKKRRSLTPASIE